MSYFKDWKPAQEHHTNPSRSFERFAEAQERYSKAVERYGEASAGCRAAVEREEERRKILGLHENVFNMTFPETELMAAGRLKFKPCQYCHAICVAKRSDFYAYVVVNRDIIMGTQRGPTVRILFRCINCSAKNEHRLAVTFIKSILGTAP